MATALRREAWDHTATLAACVLNSRMGLKRSQLVSVRKLHPMRSVEQEQPAVVLHGEAARGALRDAFGN
jgi:hypothetical protein